MKFRGNSKQLKLWFDSLITIFGQDAKIVDLGNVSFTWVGDWNEIS